MKFTKVLMRLKLGAITGETLGDATAKRLLEMYTPKQRSPAIYLPAADLTVDILKDMGFKIR